MRRTAIAALLLVAAALAAVGEVPACGQRIAVVTILDRRGAPFLGVTPADLRLSSPRGATMAAWQPVSGNARMVLLLDTSASMANDGLARAARTAALALANAAPPGRIAFVAFASSIRLDARFGASTQDVDAAIRTVKFGGGTAFYDAIVAAAHLLRGSAPGAAIVAITDADDDQSRLGPNQARRAALAAGARFFLLLTGGENAANEYNEPVGAIARHSGGLAIDLRYGISAPALWAVVEHAYVLTLRLSRPRAKQLNWKLRLGKAFRHLHRRAQILYPNPLPACQ